MKFLNKIKSPEDLKKLNIPSLNVLCNELRRFLLSSVAKTGGHLASNLGVVELTVALHYCFNSPTDKIIWDVGHQAYIHKILTGRMDEFDRLRQFGGISGFPKAVESEHDAFDTGHSSTSVSSALGLAVSRDLAGENYKVIAVIGDGSMTGGLALEGMNNAGRLNTNLLVILNDNQMSISENVGAISRHLNDIRTAPSYIGAKADVNRFLRKVPVVGEKVGKFIEKAKDGLKYILVPGVLFEEFGFTYVGPVDGHNLDELIPVLSRAANLPGPVLLHVYTTKGKGYNNAEKAPSKFHGVESFNLETGNPVQTKIWDTYSDLFGKTLVRLAERNKKIVAITAAMPAGTGLGGFQARFPDRFFDVGIAEGHAVTFAAGVAKNGFVPVFAVYSTFLQRAYDQILHDVCIQNLHVVFAIDRAGLVGADGETHQGVFDLSFLSHIPNMTILAPVNKPEFVLMLEFAIKHEGPVAIRYPRGSASRVLKDEVAEIELGKSQTVEKGSTVAIVALGSMMEIGYEVYIKLCDDGYSPTLINPRFVKPFDEDMVAGLNEYRIIAVLEDNVKIGGLGSQILPYINSPRKLLQFAYPDEFITHGERNELLHKYNLDSESIYEKIVYQLN